jgi:lipid A 3-O-deacylase PagL
MIGSHWKFVFPLALCIAFFCPALAQYSPVLVQFGSAPTQCSPALVPVPDYIPPRPPDSSIWHSLSFAVRAHYGSFIANEPKLQSVQDGHTFLGEFDIISQTSGNRAWQQAAGYPQIGLAFLYGQSGASEYIGHMAAVLPFINFPLYKTSGFTANLRLAVGPAWVEKIFNPETNYQNLVIGSHLNACLNALVSARIRILPRTDLELGLSFTHISNGSIQLPNLGLNIPALSAGFRYELFPFHRPHKEPLPPIKKKIRYSFYSFVAGKESLPLESAVYLVNVFNLEALKDISRTSRFGGGINMTLDRAQSTEVPYSVVFAFDRSQSQWQASVYIAYEYVVGNLSFPLHVGYYLYNNYPVASIYETAGVNYKFATHWSAGFALKAHLGNGDFIQWGLGYQF